LGEKVNDAEKDEKVKMGEKKWKRQGEEQSVMILEGGGGGKKIVGKKKGNQRGSQKSSKEKRGGNNSHQEFPKAAKIKMLGGGREGKTRGRRGGGEPLGQGPMTNVTKRKGGGVWGGETELKGVLQIPKEKTPCQGKMEGGKDLGKRGKKKNKIMEKFAGKKRSTALPMGGGWLKKKRSRTRGEARKEGIGTTTKEGRK